MSNPRNGLDYEAEFSNYPERLKGQLTLLDNVVRAQNPNDGHRKYAVHFLDGERISHEEFLRAIARDPASAQRERVNNTELIGGSLLQQGSMIKMI